MTEKFNDILNVQQVAEILGITAKAVYNMTAKRQIPFYKPNRKCIYFLESDIWEWILNSRVKPNTEIETIAATEPLAEEGTAEEPQPTYKVGDWVEYKKGKHHQVEYSVHDGCCYLSYGKGCGCFSALYSDITRKLDPSEVVIRIGCLSGTVRPVSTNGIHIWFHLIDANDKTIATIRITALDTPTREMVESLLRAQEEK